MRSEAPLFYTGSVVAFERERRGAVLWLVTLTNWSDGVGFTYDLLSQHATLLDVPEGELRAWEANSSDRARLGL